MPATVGLDVGTGSVKAVAFDDSARLLAEAQSPSLALATPAPGRAEQDPAEVWGAAATALTDLTSQIDATELVGMAVAAQSGSLVAIDATDRPVGPLITWMDERGREIVDEWIGDGTAERVQTTTGWPCAPGLGLSHLAWIRRREPDAWSAAARFAAADDLVTSRLTGQWVTNPSNAAGMQLMDVATTAWSLELCGLVGVEPTQLSTLRPTGVELGRVSATAAASTGLPVDLPVINGGHDQTCTALGLGVTEPGEVLVACGTAWVMTAVVTDSGIDGAPPELSVSRHVVDGRWTVSRSLGGLGASLDQWVAATYAGPGAGYASLERELAAAPPDPDGPIFVRAAGADVGTFVGLAESYTAAQEARAIMEAAAFELAVALATIGPVSRVTMVGGATRSGYWPQIVADVTGLDVWVPTGDSQPAIGAAILAGVGVGMCDSVASALGQLDTGGRLLQPGSPVSGTTDDDRAEHRDRAHGDHTP